MPTASQILADQPRPWQEVLRLWTIDVRLTRRFLDICQAAISKPIVWVSFAANVSTDLYLITIPIPVLWSTKLRLGKKIASTVVLSAGVFVLVCATLKSVFVLVVCNHPMAVQAHSTIVLITLYYIGSPPRRRTKRRMGYPGDIRRSHNDQSTHDIPPVQILARARLRQCFQFKSDTQISQWFPEHWWWGW